MADPAHDDPHDPDAQNPDDDEARRTTNIVLALFFVLVVAAGWWLVDAMVAQRKVDDCAAQGRRNCGTVVPLR
ncbi:hypothetical protein A33M_4461 [Rhodovulum sp. PH10]|uniref:hypothetical protein n=1 Tax=Rhodovulum sp. PH10 TaxID=1187851 RepID=UPI00027C2EA3|nr:hypothetical protein [Rhodovulum sp. PH10]EJW10425.1 hypothetical protein A33M_4461 [Rhodovulum sp. PH10]